nr:MAG TPA: hypothetical protein [Caudoviricetes sp.]
MGIFFIILFQFYCFIYIIDFIVKVEHLYYYPYKNLAIIF